MGEVNTLSSRRLNGVVGGDGGGRIGEGGQDGGDRNTELDFQRWRRDLGGDVGYIMRRRAEDGYGLDDVSLRIRHGYSPADTS